jgi:hypothetical protein
VAPEFFPNPRDGKFSHALPENRGPRRYRVRAVHTAMVYEEEPEIVPKPVLWQGHTPISYNLHHMTMENQTSISEATPNPGSPNPGKWVGQLVAAVILAEGIWGFLVSLTSNLLVPLLARGVEGDPQSPLYLGKGVVNVPALFNSTLELCLAGIVFVLLYEWSRRRPATVRVKTVLVTKKISQPSAGPPSIMAAPAPAAAPIPPPPTPPPARSIPQAPVSVSPVPIPQQSKPTPPPPVAASAKPAKPKPPKEVYYNIVGEPINPTEED